MNVHHNVQKDWDTIPVQVYLVFVGLGGGNTTKPKILNLLSNTKGHLFKMIYFLPV